jgi:hypothetical protein
VADVLEQWKRNHELLFACRTAMKEKMAGPACSNSKRIHRVGCLVRWRPHSPCRSACALCAYAHYSNWSCAALSWSRCIPRSKELPGCQELRAPSASASGSSNEAKQHLKIISHHRANWRLRGCFPLDSRPLCWAASRAIRGL